MGQVFKIIAEFVGSAHELRLLYGMGAVPRVPKGHDEGRSHLPLLVDQVGSVWNPYRRVNHILREISQMGACFG